jgi:hypothetical protein
MAVSGSRGWYPDPDDPSKVRHWNGHEWGGRARSPKTHVVVKVVTIIVGIVAALVLLSALFLFVALLGCAVSGEDVCFA